MKLPIPKLRIPFLNRGGSKGGGAEDDVDLDQPLEEFDAPETAPETAPEEAASGEAGAETETEALEDPEAPVDDPPSDPPSESRLKRLTRRVAAIAGTIGFVFLALTVIGGTGGVFGWLLVNAEYTTAKRDQLRPNLTVRILDENETPTANTTAQEAPESGEGQEAGGDGSEGQVASATPDATPLTPRDGVFLAPVDEQLYEEVEDLTLPIIGLDGRQVWSTYARPFDVDDPRPRLGLLVINLGLDDAVTEAAITELPGQVTLSFSPYARDLSALLARARQAGHEVLVDLPMEPLDFPRDDPGPQTLLTSLATVENLNRLDWVLGQAQGYVGVASWMGSQFTTVEDAMMPVLETLKERGVMFLDARDSSRSLAAELASSIQLPRSFNNRFIDSSPSQEAIDRAMQDLEQTARQQDYAIGIASPLPLTISRLAAWVPALEARGVAIAPISALADRQRLR